ncbi:hypothetical protein [Myxococcus xanthus]|uniref:Uncharacterized protein n=1 Tax=Myxococcus xanthus TaxID=34 RepID=A0AAE6FY34_MYXXA|nr:hypothetical protein [Myxococcus xanthus]QDE67398.1 hypothetical protein BHS09_10610 [Myxococcus xanthus]QDE74674.1 hypothetical protein BHS08_10625 [Myxococcus xanthus]QDE81954.1 hypothetical protein BHS07_10595 [Myxococcus xanthus]QDF03716.1 hypothetical protein BHS04_10975 [Myxococcus xanthus]
MVGSYDGSGNPLPGSIQARGTAEAPIRFGPDDATATKGHWAGFQFSRDADSTLEHITITAFTEASRQNVFASNDVGTQCNNP